MPPGESQRFHPDTPLIQLTKHDTWCIRDACEGTHVFGATGAGKTSGSGNAIAPAFLHQGFGGLVMTAKPDEVELWKRYARMTGTEDRFLFVRPGSPHCFNFLDYEWRRPGGGQTANLINLFYSVIEAVEGEKSRSSDSYWDRTLQQLLRNAIDLLGVAENRISLQALQQVIQDAPQKPADLADPDWERNSFCLECMRKGHERIQRKDVSETRERDFGAAVRYFLDEYPKLSEKTRSIIVSSLTSMADCLLRGEMHNLFCTKTTIFPELCRQGHVIVLDLPIKTWGHVGRIAQMVFKHVWQEAMERNPDGPPERPVFLWADEAQFFMSLKDLDFQTTARSSRIATVYLSQNLQNYYTIIKDKERVGAILANLNTKVMHANGCTTTNQWAADLISRSWQSKTSISGTQDREKGGNVTISRSLDHDVQPQQFTRMRIGGDRNERIVEGILFQNGRIFSNGQTWLRLFFPQE